MGRNLRGLLAGLLLASTSLPALAQSGGIGTSTSNPSSGSGSPTGTAGGSLGGTYPNPTVVTNANLTGPVTSVGNATRTAAAFTMGAVDSASPVAETISVPSVATGTADTAGALWTFKDSNGTGTGGSGGYSWFTAAPSTTGSTPLTQTAKMTLSNGGNLQAVNLIAATSIAAGSSGSYSWTGRGVLSSPAAGSVQFGNTDAAAPVAQTTSAQGVITGTSNTAGALWKFSDSAGTGTAASGGYEWDTHPAGSTGSTPNVAASKMTLSSGGTLSVSGNLSTSGGLFAFGNAANAAIRVGASGTYQFGGADIAAPQAQTFQTQGVVAGTTNTAGALTTFQDSPGTGTGASGGLEWDTHPAGSTGSTQNAAVSKMTLSTTGTLSVNGTVVTGGNNQTTGNVLVNGSTSVIITKGYTVAGLPASPGTGARAHVTDATSCTFLGALTGGSSTFCPVVYNGSAWVGE